VGVEINRRIGKTVLKQYDNRTIQMDDFITITLAAITVFGITNFIFQVIYKQPYPWEN